MTWLRTLSATAAALLMLLAPAPAGASHSPNGSGGCNAHTRACYPDCWYEWTGQRGTTVDPPVDGGPCLMPPVNPQTVMVGNLPTTQAVSGTVTADKGTGWTDAGVDPASNVSLINDDASPVPVRLAKTETNVGLLSVIGAAAGAVLYAALLWTLRHYRGV